MNTDYLLEQLIRAGRNMRLKQKTYYKTPGQVKDNPIKKACLDDSKEAEYKFDRLLSEIEKVHPVPLED